MRRRLPAIAWVVLVAVGGFHFSAQARDAALYEAALAEVPGLLNTLERLVNIETETGEADGMRDMSNVLAHELEALGATVTRHKAAATAVGENIVGTISGDGGRRLLLMAHMDTVYPKGTLSKYPFRLENGNAHGPGIADDKGGIALILHALRVMNERKLRRFGSITVVFNTDEEKGSLGSRDLIVALAKESDVILSFEPSSAGHESLTLGTSGIANVTAIVKGKSSHAGSASEAGVSALVEAADLVMRTQGIDDRRNALRFNWTVMRSGGASNVIPQEAVLSADVRYASNEDLDAALKELQAAAKRTRSPAAHVEIHVVRGRPAFTGGADDEALIDKAQSIYAEVGGQLTVVDRIGAGTDIAYAALAGKPVIEMLGLPGGEYHGSGGEFIDVSSIPRRLYMTLRLIGELGHAASSARPKASAPSGAIVPARSSENVYGPTWPATIQPLATRSLVNTWGREFGRGTFDAGTRSKPAPFHLCCGSRSIA